MMPINALTSDNNSNRTSKLWGLSFFHRVTCVFGVLTTVYYLLMLLFSYSGALQDMHKLGGLGFSHSLGYYLVNNSFPEAIGMALPVTGELLIYVALCQRVRTQKGIKGAIGYFTTILVFHVFMWLHAGSLDIPKSPPFVTAEGLGLRYYIFTSITLVQSTAYFVLFILHVRNSKNVLS